MANWNFNISCMLVGGLLICSSICGCDSTSEVEVRALTMRPAGRSRTATPSVPAATLQLTEVAAQQLLEIMKMEGKESAYVLVSVNVVENCSGFQYDLNLGPPEPADKYEVSVSKNVKIAVEKDDAKFLQGTVLDYILNDEHGQRGLKFDNPHEDVMLLPEYQQMAEQKRQEWEMNKKKAETIDTQKAVAELMTPSRQSAYESLEIYNRYFGLHPELKPPTYGTGGWDVYEREVSHVMEIPDGASEKIIAVFTDGSAGEPKGGCSLFDQKGIEVPFYGNANYLDDDNSFSDINGDGIIETSQTIRVGVKPKADGQTVRGIAQEFFIATVGRNPQCLLTIHFDAHKLPRDSEWKCRLIPSEVDGIFDVVLEKPGPDGLQVVATYKWLPDKKQYSGPLSGPGFIARMGDISADEGSKFWHAEMGE